MNSLIHVELQGRADAAEGWMLLADRLRRVTYVVKEVRPLLQRESDLSILAPLEK